MKTASFVMSILAIVVAVIRQPYSPKRGGVGLNVAAA